MIEARLRDLLTAIGVVGALAVSNHSGVAAAAEGELRVCASEKEAPYSMTGAEGFENRIAMVVAEAMGRKPVFIWSTRPAIYAVRDQLDKGLCDVVMGVDLGDERMLTTKPYYRSGYAFVSRADRPIEGSSWKAAGASELKRFAVRFHSPAEVMLRELGKYENNLIYVYSLVNFTDRRNQYTQVAADRLVAEVASGEADLAIAFAPDVGRYVKASSTPLQVTMISDDLVRASGQRIPLQYEQSIGVRKDAKDLLDEVNAALDAVEGKISAILTEEGVPIIPSST